MNQTSVESQTARSGERGGARLKFMIVALVIGALAYGGYLFIPVWYQFWVIKDRMKTEVDVASTSGKPPASVSERLRASAAEINLPPEAVITPVQEGNLITVRVQFTRNVELPGYTYHDEFDYTATSTALIGTVK